MKWLLNIASNYLRFIAALVIMAVMTPYIINTIGTQMYGLWALVYAAIGLINLSDLGFSTAAVKFLAEQQGSGNQQRRNQLLGSLLLVYAAIAVMCAGLVIGLTTADWVPGSLPEGRDLFLMLGLTTSICLFCNVFRAGVIANGQQGLLNLVTLAVILLQALATWYLLEQGYGIHGIAWANCAGLLAQALICIPMCKLLLINFKPTLAPEWRLDIRRIARFSVWAFIANGAFMLIMRIDPFFVESLLSLESVAMLAIALKIAEQILLFNKQFSNALMPLISQQHGRGEGAASAAVFTLGTKYLLALASPFTLLTAASAGSLIHVWVGAEMVAAAPSLSLLCIAALLSTMQFNAANLLGMTGQARQVALNMAGSAITKIIVTLLAIEHLGLLGCALGTLVGALLFECFGNLRRACALSQQSLTAFFIKALAPGLVSCLPFVALAYGVNHSHQHNLELLPLLLLNATAGLASLGTFYLFFVSASERAQLRSLLKKESNLCPAPLSTAISS